MLIDSTNLIQVLDTSDGLVPVATLDGPMGTLTIQGPNGVVNIPSVISLAGGGAFSGTWTGSPTLTWTPTWSGHQNFAAGADIAGGALSSTFTGDWSFAGNVAGTGTGAFGVPVGTTGQQPNSGLTGQIRYNTTTGRYEFGIGSAWKNHVRLDGDTMTGALATTGNLTAGSGTANPIVMGNGFISMSNNVSLSVNSGANGTAFIVAGLGSSITNQVKVVPSTTGNGPTVQAAGGDAGIDLNLLPKNTFNGQTSAVRVNGRIFMNYPQITWSGGAVATNAALWDGGSYTGTSTAGGFLYNINTSDGVQAATAPIYVLNVAHKVSGAAAGGGRTAINGQMWQNGATNDTALGTDPFYTGVNGIGIMSTTIGTGLTPSTAKGHVFGMNAVSRLSGTPQNVYAVSACEFNVEADTGSTFLRRTGIQIVMQNTGATGSFGGDAGLLFAADSGMDATTYGWDIGVSFGNELSGGFDVRSTGTLIKTVIGNGHGGSVIPTVAHGIDLLSLSASVDVFRSRGFSVDGSGTVQVGTAYLTPSASGLDIDAKGSVGTGTPTIAAGGTGYVVNDPIYFQSNGIAKVTAVSGGVVTAVSIIQQPYVSGATPSNPVATTTWALSPGSGLTLNLSWTTTATQLALQAGGGALKTGSGTWSANGSVATALSSVGPTGSHTTVQEWFTVKNASGTVRYIPAF